MPFDATPVRSPELEILDKVVSLISTPRKWLKEGYTNEKENRYCLLGAFYVATHGNHLCELIELEGPRFLKFLEDGKFKEIQNVLDAIGPYLPEWSWARTRPNSIVQFNDSWRTRHKDVMNLLTKAREKLVEQAILKAKA